MSPVPVSPLTAMVLPSGEMRLSLGAGHPLGTERYRLTLELMRSLGLLTHPEVLQVVAPPATEEQLETFHGREYLAVLREFSQDSNPRADFRFGLGDGDNPVVPGLYEWVRSACGASLEAVRRVMAGDCRRAFNLMGGFHHAFPNRASGFCFLNDVVLAILQALREGARVAYVDLDAHHGDGVQEAFFSSSRVLTISLHEKGQDFFPFSGGVEEFGEGAGYGYAVNIPLRSHADDLIFDQALCQIILPLLRAFKPDLLVTQVGMDGLRNDPLARLEMTTASLEKAASEFFALDIPWVALGGGGYHLGNAVRGWTLVWNQMLGGGLVRDWPDDPEPEAWSSRLAAPALRDRPRLAGHADFSAAQADFDRISKYLRRQIFPLHGLVS